ncbi:MAG: hypothetical protein GIKADHBN_03086 [Phycisphaerales bacterium]|nr:hypothetical protein [Phycisphaerales bacterium]
MNRTLADAMSFAARTLVARPRTRCAALLMAAAGLAQAQSFSPYLAADLNTSPLTSAGSQPGGLVGQVGFARLGSGTMFSAYDREHGSELWFTDGTLQGTRLVKDIQPGSRSSNPSWMATLGSRVVFAAYTDDSGTELWITDGTEAGTVLITELAPGIQSITPQYCRGAGDQVFFVTASTSQLWRTDGTAAGTVALSPSGANVNNLQVAGERAFFSAFESSTGIELWTSDGTIAGTALVEEIGPGTTGTVISNMYAIDDRIVFFPYRSDIGYEPWVSDGTAAGTFLLRDIEEGPYSSYVDEAVAFDGKVYFAYDQTGYGYELWRTDGTIEGTTIAADVSPGADSSYPSRLVATDGGLVFLADVYPAGRNLYSLTPSGVVKLTSYDLSDNFYVYEAVSAAGRAYMLSADPSTYPDYQLWSTDGTVAGTHILAGDTSYVNLVASPVNAGVFLNVDDGSIGPEPWFTTGEPGTLSLLKDINAGVGDSFPRQFIGSAGSLVFTADDSAHGRELWRINPDGSTALIEDLNPGPGSTSVLATQPLNDQAVMWIQTGAVGAEPWITDATPSGTHLIADVRPGTAGSYSYPTSNTLPTTISGSDRLYYSTPASSSSSANELAVTDGTASGTIVLDINTKPNSGSLGGGINGAMISRVLLFAADNGVNGPELWRTDGSVAGTWMIKEFISGAAGGLSLTDNRFIALGNKVLLGATDNIIGSELWISDGTPGGTTIVKDIRPGSSGSQPNPIAVVGNKAILLATTTTEGRELWVTDGTAPGTALLKDTNPGAGSSSILSRPLVTGGKAFFLASTPANGRELWVSDATPAGTFMVLDIRPGPISSTFGLSPLLAAAGGRVFFQADDGVHGVELWVSDGTPEGTSMVGDLWPGLPSSYPSAAGVYGSTLYFDAYRPQEGKELWALKVCPADFDNSGFVDRDDFDAFVEAFVAGDDAADFDGSGFVDESDYAAFVRDFEAGC